MAAGGGKPRCGCDIGGENEEVELPSGGKE